MQIRLGRGGHEVVVFSGMEFHSSWGGTERSKTDGVVPQIVGFIAKYNGSGLCGHDSAHVILFFVDSVNDKSFSMLLRHGFVIQGTQNVDLVVLHEVLGSALVHIYDVIRVVNAESATKKKRMGHYYRPQMLLLN